MNILIICESFHSANYNIAMKLAEELKKNNEIFVGYYLTYGETIINKCGEFRDEFIVQDGTFETEYPKIKNNTVQRIKYLLFHPLIFIMLLINHSFIKTHPDQVSCSRRLEKYCKEKSIDTVIGIAYPYEILMIVSGIKGIENKNGIQLDPYSYNYETLMNGEKLHRIRLKQEINVLYGIKKLFTTGLIKSDLVKADRIKKESNKIIEIEYPLIESKENESRVYNDIIIKNNDENVAFLHAGNFYNDIRSPEKLVKLFEMLPDNYILYVAGSNSGDIRKYDERIRSRVIDLGRLPIEKAEQARKEADILISYNNLVENQVPSKLFECINEGKPFINLCQIPDCPTLPYVEGYEMAYTVFTYDMEKSCKGLIDFVDKKKGKKIDRGLIVNRFRKCTVEYLTKLIMDEISK